MVPDSPEEDMVGMRVRDRLTPKEMRIVALIVQGCKNREIAIRLKTTEQVIKNYLRSIYDKTGRQRPARTGVVHHPPPGAGRRRRRGRQQAGGRGTGVGRRGVIPDPESGGTYPAFLTASQKHPCRSPKCSAGLQSVTPVSRPAVRWVSRPAALGRQASILALLHAL